MTLYQYWIDFYFLIEKEKNMEDAKQLELKRMGEFTYQRELKELKILYKSMMQLDVSIGTFNHRYNDVGSSVIFDTQNADGNGWKLIFMKIGVGTILEIFIRKGFIFSIRGNAEYQEFIRYFNVSGKKGEFSINDFINHLCNSIPSQYALNTQQRFNISRYRGDQEGIYPISFINWELIRARNPENTKSRSAENLAKTKELYPALYRATKDKDISIGYGNEPSNRTKGLSDAKISSDFFNSKD